jgi:hypothetical protein
MSDKQFEKLNEVFNLPKQISESPINADIIESDNKSDSEVRNLNIINDIKKDYDYTRGNLYSIIEKGQEAINGILELAQETEQARAYEVAGQLIKNVADATDKLMDLQKKLKDIEEVKKSSGPTNVTNALFVGSTAELSKLLKSQKNQEDNK